MLLAIFCIGFIGGWCCAETLPVVRAWKEIAEQARAEKTYYLRLADGIIDEGRARISASAKKGKPYGKD